jgi:hypothetical protein
MKKQFSLIIALFAFCTIAQATVEGGGAQYTEIVVIEDLWGINISANDPGANGMERIRVLDANGSIVYLDRNANPSQEFVSYSGWAPGLYQLQIDMETGYDIHFFQVSQ